MFDLIVTADFGGYKKGDRITDKDSIDSLIDSASVVKVTKLQAVAAKAEVQTA